MPVQHFLNPLGMRLYAVEWAWEWSKVEWAMCQMKLSHIVIWVGTTLNDYVIHCFIKVPGLIIGMTHWIFSLRKDSRYTYSVSLNYRHILRYQDSTHHYDISYKKLIDFQKKVWNSCFRDFRVCPILKVGHNVEYDNILEWSTSYISVRDGV